MKNNSPPCGKRKKLWWLILRRGNRKQNTSLKLHRVALTRMKAFLKCYKCPQAVSAPHSQAALPPNISTGAYFLYPAEQRTSMWFGNSHVYPSNPYHFSVTCVWISGLYLTLGTRSLWKRIPNVTVRKHILLLQQAWGPQAALNPTNNFHEIFRLGGYNSNPVCLYCQHMSVFSYQRLGYQSKSTVCLSP